MQETRILAGQENDPRHQNPRPYPFSSLSLFPFMAPAVG